VVDLGAHRLPQLLGQGGVAAAVAGQGPAGTGGGGLVAAGGDQERAELAGDFTAPGVLGDGAGDEVGGIDGVGANRVSGEVGSLRRGLWRTEFLPEPEQTGH
jgi:hypothetical protein